MEFFKSKRAQLILTVSLCVILVAAGTFAWYSATQNALNEFSWSPDIDDVKESINLHDDFSDPNKDIYAENTGTVPLIVRIRLSEFMNIGNVLTSSIPANGVKSNKATWHSHNGNLTTNNCDEAFHDYWTWIMGGQKWYIPATASQILAEGDEAVVRTDVLPDGLPLVLSPYYTSYSDLLSKVAQDSEMLELLSALQSAKSTLAATISSGAQQAAVDAARLALYTVQKEVNEYSRTNFHGIQLSRPATVLTMNEWLSGDDSSRGAMELGDFWVVDTDGWCYWANNLEAGEATGLLLNSVTPTSMIDDLKSNRTAYYYGIDVTMDAVTVDDIDKFTSLASGNAQILLGIIANAVNVNVESFDALLEIPVDENINDDITNDELINNDINNDDIINDDLTNDDMITDDTTNADIANDDTTNNDITNDDLINDVETDIEEVDNDISDSDSAADENIVTNNERWYYSDGFWKYYDGQWAFDGYNWSLNSAEYSFDSDGWYYEDDKAKYKDSNWYYDGKYWSSLN